MNIVIVSYVEELYGDRGNITQALNDISLVAEKQESTAVMGTSGSRKTTLLNVISTIDTVGAGNIEINGNGVYELWESELAESRKKESRFVFQDFSPPDTPTLQGNVVLPSILLEKKAERIDPQVSALAGILQIQNILEKHPYQVSGSRYQRCACAKAMIHGPSLILADESASTPDSHSSYLLVEQFQRVNTEPQAMILMVIHDVLSVSYTKRILLLEDGTIFNEIYRSSLTRRAFFQKILDVIQLLGSDVHTVH